MKLAQHTKPKEEYFHLWIAAAKDHIFFENNLDKAYIISLFQDLLSPRPKQTESHSYAEHVDLIAYSLTDYGVNVLLAATHSKAVEDFGQTLLTRYAQFLQEQQTWEILPFDTIFAYDKVNDEHEALSISREIHLLHRDWRNDRYSSIGFYLDDRRGDWLKAWLLADLYENDANWYENFLLEESTPRAITAFGYIET